MKRFAPGFVTWRISVSTFILFLPHVDYGAIAHRGNCPVLLASHQSLLLEAMQDVDGFLELGDVHHVVNTTCLPDPNLPRARTHVVERLPVSRLKSGLDHSLRANVWCQSILSPYFGSDFVLGNNRGMASSHRLSVNGVCPEPSAFIM